MSDVTLLISAIEIGDPAAAEQLLPLVYAELRRLAAIKMANEPVDQTLQATALVHEAYLRLVDMPQKQSWKSRGHFFAAAAVAMQRILVENARRRKQLKHGGAMLRVDIDDVAILPTEDATDLIALDEALTKLKSSDSQSARLVQLRYFAGLTIAEAAEVLNISPSCADRLWVYARTWLHREIEGRTKDFLKTADSTGFYVVRWKP